MPDRPVTFTPSGTCSQLYFADCADDITHTGFLLPPDAANPPAELTLNAAWAAHPAGCFVFLPGWLPEAQHTAFAAAAWHFLSAPSRVGARFAWFFNPEAGARGLRGMFIAVHDDPDPATDRVSAIGQRNYQVLVGKGCTVAPDDAGQRFVFRQPDAGSIALLNGEARSGITGDLHLSLCGVSAGTLRFTMTLDPDAFDVGLRYFYRVPGYTDVDVFPIASQRYPVFDAALPVDAHFDPLHPEYTYFNFPIEDGAPLKSHFHTTHGHPILLTPVENSGCRLVYAERKLTNDPAAENHPLYLVPVGDYRISVGRPPGPAPANRGENLLCGISGVEYIKTPPGKSDLLCFHPEHPAFATTFTPGAEIPPPPSNSILSDLVTTSWVLVRREGGGRAVYHAQPEEAVLYAAPSGTDPDPTDAPMLDYMEVPAADLPAPIDGMPPPAFPMAPYGGVRTALLDHYRQLEMQVLNPARRTRIFALTAQPLAAPASTRGILPDLPGHVGATPQGLVAHYAHDFETLTDLFLAIDTKSTPLKWTNIGQTSPLRAALQSNQLFLVITDPTAIRTYFADNQLDIENWVFDLDPDSWQQQGTILILKYYDKPITELAENRHMWSFPDEFTADAAQAQRALLGLIDEALKKSPEFDMPDTDPEAKANYRALSRALRLENWSGILALNVPVPPDGFPDALKGLAAGIDLDRFFAQFVGIETTPIHLVRNDTKLEASTSSMFGLINYENDKIPPPNPSGYNFRVLYLRVRFANSQIADFACEIAVTLDTLFEEKATLVDSLSGRNEVFLAGRYEEHDGEGRYSFSFVGANRFTLESSILYDVQILKASFATEPPPQPRGFNNGDTVRSRFSFWGRLNFRQMGAFDLLSFGGTGEDGFPTAQYLTFANMGLDMSFTWDTEATEIIPAFSFDAGQMHFDPAQSPARPNSVYSKFPLRLTGLATAQQGGSPDALGYMPVTTPGGALKPEGVWYGLSFDLDLGSKGALANKAGLVVSLIAAWAPGGDGVYTGLKLPGSSGGKQEITIQGVLKLTFKRILFQVSIDDAGDAHYVLKLKNILLKFLALSIPPSGQTEIVIFGDPQATPDDKTLGWYAAYARRD